MREERRFQRIKVLAGIVEDEGAYFIPNYFGLEDGIQPAEFQNLIYEFVVERNATNQERSLESLEFEYTYYEDPKNITGIRNRSIALMSDYMFGSGVDEVVKYHARYNATYFYVFRYKSHYDYLPPWRGVAHGQDLQYVFGFPYFSRCYSKITGIYPRQDYSVDDIEMSNYMMTVWTNFTLHGAPTPSRDDLKYFRDVYWPPFQWNNQSYMIIDNHTRVSFRYRQQEYMFWTDYFPKVSLKFCQGSPVVKIESEKMTTFMKTTWALVVINAILLIILLAFSITICRLHRQKGF
uniref:Carboxylesterase type B domain-containing protein n=2 Tax=Octopus bimaculoides TaxID=37653 RepID=A0A0L8I3T8_OCTBM